MPRRLYNHRPDYRHEAFIKDDFMGGNATQLGELSWAIAAGTVAPITVGTGHPGIVNVNTTAGSGTAAGIILYPASTGMVLVGDPFDMTWVVRLNTNDANTTIRMGLSGSFANPPGNGIYFEKLDADTSWFGVGRTGGVQTRSTAVAATSTGWVTLRMRLSATGVVSFQADGGTIQTVATNVPSGAQSPYFHMINSAAAAKNADIDYVELWIGGLSRI